ncbi:MmgE/PrpD family protein [Rubrimonas sp.]|uniref:MmgE/PrpD family protein n=1 Tax=Rubrimonas sp. TaxID=2036015 RepID=UPI002FDF0439
MTGELATHIAASRTGDLPDAVRAEGVRALVNIVGCSVGGAGEEAVSIALDAFAPFFGPATAAILGRRERCDPLHAALFNGIASHVHDFDDTMPKNYIHASSPVASALFAYASTNSVTGRDFLHAFVLGFEVTARVGNATYPAHYDAGWHSTGTCGVFGAAAAVGWLLALPADRMVHALGLAATQASGLREMFGAMGKAFHPGHAARNGYEAALLARGGFTSGRYPLEGPRGFGAVTSGFFAADRITGGLGRDFEILGNAYKPFPCGIVNHPAIDAALQLRAEHTLDPASIAAVRLRVAPLVMDLCGKRDISTGLEGKFSVVHGAAVALVRGKAGLREYTDEGVNDPEVSRVRNAAVPEGDPAVSEDGVRIEVTLKDGTVLAKSLTHSLGNLARPLSEAQLDEKFLDQAVLRLPEAKARRLLAATRGIEELADVGELVRLAVPDR